MKKILRDIINMLRLRKRNDVIVKSGANISGSYFDGFNAVGNNTSLLESRIGVGSYIGSQCYISHANIGKFCSIGSRVYMSVGQHPSSDWVSTSPVFYSNAKQCGLSFVQKNKFNEKKYVSDSSYISIGNDVWIGDNVTLLPGIRIGDGVIIAAGSIVTKDVSPFSIVGGNPAKLIRQRFSDSDIDFLLCFKWWEKDLEWLCKHADLFRNVKFLRESFDENFNNSK